MRSVFRWLVVIGSLCGSVHLALACGNHHEHAEIISVESRHLGEEQQHDHASWCGTPTPHPSHEAEFAAFAKDWLHVHQRRKLKADEEFQAKVPVYVHAITPNINESNFDVSDEMIDNQIQVLNDSFSAAGFSFELKRIQRIVNEEWFFSQPFGPGDVAMRQALHQGGLDSLNIYLTSVGNTAQAIILGFTTLPSFFNIQNPRNDGILLYPQVLPGGPLPCCGLGKRLVHEVGHWLNLYHPFSSGNCKEDGDYVSDTAFQSKATPFNCPQDPLTEANSCPFRPGVDNIHNFMDYSDDSCMESFTPGQIERMQLAWEIFRDPSTSSLSLCERRCQLSTTSTGFFTKNYDSFEECVQTECRGDTCENPITLLQTPSRKSGKGIRRLQGSSAKSAKAEKSNPLKTVTVSGNTNLAVVSDVSFGFPPGCDGVLPRGTAVRWYQVVGQPNGFVQVSTFSTSVETSISVYRGTCGMLECVVATDRKKGSQLEALDGGNQLAFVTVPGETYWIAVMSNYAGDFQLTASVTTKDTPGSDCFTVDPRPGCTLDECQTSVCALSPSCCTDAWTKECAQLACTECTAEAPPGCGCLIDIALLTDDLPAETRFTVSEDPFGGTPKSVSYGPFDRPQWNYNFEIDTSDENGMCDSKCFEFEILDSGGDGLIPPGGFSVGFGFSERVQYDSAFGSSFKVAFGDGCSR